MSKKLEDAITSEAGLKQLLSQLDGLNDEVQGSTEVLGAAGGAAMGAAGSFAALYGLGVTGLSAAGITSGLAAAGALIGGGMVAGIGVLAFPIAILAVSGYAFFHHRKQKRIRALQRDALEKAVEKQNTILGRLQQKSDLSVEMIAELNARNQLLGQVILQLKSKVKI